MAAALLRLLLLLLFALSTLPFLLDSASDSLLYGGCSQIKYPPHSSYLSNLNSLLNSLLNSATYSCYNKFTIMGSSPSDVVYGLYQCRGDLSMPDCASCIARSISQLATLCPQTCGGVVQLQGCFVKYDNSTFLGVEDRAVVFKKCGPSVGYNVEEMGLRDAVLGGMASGGGPYRVGGSGDVQGVAQCVGDLSTGKCQDCISTAIERLKNDCGTASYGDMFLGKCYARYLTGGAQGFYKKGDGSSINGSEKTFAVVAGVLAAVALVFIFLTFLKKILQGNGK